MEPLKVKFVTGFHLEEVIVNDLKGLGKIPEKFSVYDLPKRVVDDLKGLGKIPDGFSVYDLPKGPTKDLLSKFFQDVLSEDETEIREKAFENCKSLAEVYIPDGVTKIGDTAFAGCEALTKVNIPDSVKEIGSGAFIDCKSLANVRIPDGVTKIENHTFGYCNSLKEVYIPDSVKEIGEAAFIECSSLKMVQIPYFVKKIGFEAFRDCSSLSRVVINQNMGVVNIGEGVFSGCVSLTEEPCEERDEVREYYDAVERDLAESGILFGRTISRLEEFGLSKEDIDTLQKDRQLEAQTPAGKVQILYRNGAILVGDRKEQLGQALWRIKKDPGYLRTLVKPEKKTDKAKKTLAQQIKMENNLGGHKI